VHADKLEVWCALCIIFSTYDTRRVEDERVESMQMRDGLQFKFNPSFDTELLEVALSSLGESRTPTDRTGKTGHRDMLEEGVRRRGFRRKE